MVSLLETETIWKRASWQKVFYTTKKVLNIQDFLSAADRNRTGTGIATHGILSPGRLPVPPLRHLGWAGASFTKTPMDGDGFEPSKRVATDLQSAPFGHSGIHPNARISIDYIITTPSKKQVFFT